MKAEKSDIRARVYVMTLARKSDSLDASTLSALADDTNPGHASAVSSWRSVCRQIYALARLSAENWDVEEISNGVISGE